MDLIVCDDLKSVYRTANEWSLQEINKHNAQKIFIPAGNTPIGLYKIWEQEKPSALSHINFLQVDDVMTGVKKGLFRQFFNEHLPSYTHQITWIEKGNDVGDLGILGLGLNGHVAFHEPELGPNFYSGCVHLSEQTCKNLGLEKNTWGISYGTSAFLRTKSILMIVFGESKREILQKLLSSDPSVPASQLLNHPNFTIVTDKSCVQK